MPPFSPSAAAQGRLLILLATNVPVGFAADQSDCCDKRCAFHNAGTQISQGLYAGEHMFSYYQVA